MSTFTNKVWKAAKKLGVTRVADNTQLDNLGIPVVVAIRPGVSSEQITSCQGKGMTFDEALSGALCEVIERYCATKAKVNLSASSSMLSEKGSNFLPPPSFGIKKVGGEDIIDWILVENLLDKKKYLIPASEIIFPYFPTSSKVKKLLANTSGLAAGVSKSDSIIRSIYEVMERDAVSRYYEKLDCPCVNTKTIFDAELVQLLGKLKKNNISINIIDLSKYSILPTYIVHLLDLNRKDSHLFVSGQATHFYPQVALKKAILEAIQTRIVATQSSREDLVRFEKVWNTDFKHIQASFNYFLSNSIRSGVVRNSFLHKEKKSGPRLSSILKLLKENGFQYIFYKDLSQDQLPVKVSRVCILGLADTFINKERKRKYVSKKI